MNDRQRVLAFVANIIDAWKNVTVRLPGAPPGIRRHVGELQAELAEMQTTSERGAILARRWAVLIP